MRRITMRPRVLSRSPFTLIPLTLIGVWGVTARAAGQEMQLTSRPRVLAALPHAAKRLDATNAPVLRRRVSIDVDGAALGVALKKIARQADLYMLYDDGAGGRLQPGHAGRGGYGGAGIHREPRANRRALAPRNGRGDGHRGPAAGRDWQRAGSGERGLAGAERADQELRRSPHRACPRG